LEQQRWFGQWQIQVISLTHSLNESEKDGLKLTTTRLTNLLRNNYKEKKNSPFQVATILGHVMT